MGDDKMSVFTLDKDICQIVFKVSSDKCTVRLTGMDESIEDYRGNLSPDSKYMTNFTIKALAADDEDTNIMDIGRIEGIIFESEMLISEALGFVELCDMVSSDVYEMAEAITDRDGNIKPSVCLPEYNILYIKKLFVEEKCRGMGVGRYLLDNINPLLLHSLNVNPCVCILTPYPQIKTQLGYIDRATENVDKELPRLVRFYEKAGFTKMDDSECMYKRCTDSLDGLFEMLKG